MTRNRVKAALFFFLAVFVILQIFFPRFEGFAVTLYGAEMGKQKGAKCQFDPECASNTCIPFDNKEGTRFTCS